jgi:multidrug efflux system membrane fusion protein
LSTDPKEHQPIGPDHQLPAPTPAHPQHKGIRVAVWIALLLVFAVAFLLILRHHDDTTKSAAASRHGAGGAVALTTATAKQGNLGVYLDAIGTVTPVYTASIVTAR